MPTIVTAGSASGGFSATRTLTFTSALVGGYTPVADDVLILGWNDNAPGAAPLAIQADWPNVLPVATVLDSGTNGVGAISHVVTAAEVTAGTTTWTLTNIFSANRSGRRWGIVIRGADPVNPIDTIVTRATTATSMTVPDMTATKTGSLYIVMGGPDDFQNIGDPVAPWSTYTQVDGGGTTTAFTMCVYSAALAAGVPVVGPTIPLSNNDDYALIGVALAPISVGNSGVWFQFLP